METLVLWVRREKANLPVQTRMLRLLLAKIQRECITKRKIRVYRWHGAVSTGRSWVFLSAWAAMLGFLGGSESFQETASVTEAGAEAQVRTCTGHPRSAKKATHHPMVRPSRSCLVCSRRPVQRVRKERGLALIRWLSRVLAMHIFGGEAVYRMRQFLAKASPLPSFLCAKRLASAFLPAPLTHHSMRSSM